MFAPESVVTMRSPHSGVSNRIPKRAAVCMELDTACFEEWMSKIFLCGVNPLVSDDIVGSHLCVCMN